jgi:L-lactate dehydrogenase complex protein LldG
MSERAKILARIGEALAVSAPLPGHTQGKAGVTPPLPSSASQRGVLPAVGQSFEEQQALFRKNAAELRADFKPVADAAEMVRELKAMLLRERWTRAAAHRGELSRAAAEALGLPVLWTDSGYAKTDLAGCDVGISECDLLVAQTGTVVVTSRSAGGRALSCLPPHHVVIARRDQLVPDLPAAFEYLKSAYGSQYPSMISFITGPSRTGDIERILVLGAHGPRQLTVFCIE